jgi:hypothetical protein
VQFSTKLQRLPVRKARIIDWIINKEYWQPALDQHGNGPTDACTARRAPNYFSGPAGAPGAQPSLLDTDWAPDHRAADQLTTLARGRSWTPGTCPRPV